MAVWTEREFDIRMGRLLQRGVLLAAIVVVIGAVVFLVESGGTPASYHVFRGVSPGLGSIRAIAGSAFRGEGSGLILLGVLLTVATPVARVVFACYAFLRQRDWLYLAVSMTVLSLLLYGLWHSA